MKVLFAVSNEEISESIVKRYQKEYKEILSYKNVYYFNAILKEIQKDKSYDRIVISEDLEAFSHTQYDQIDKFIFEKLDSISDEASNLRGNDTPIILICSDRRTKSEQMLVKLFGIGIYNAIIGNDRSVEEVCRLIHRPRLKKEAKSYYKIDAEEVNYAPENENDVSEMEIQNILAHYKSLGKNEDRYIESFDNIAAQYNDKQLRIIAKFLPLNVKAVLEERSPKYQQVMSFNNKLSNTLRKPKETQEEQGTSEKLLKSKIKSTYMTKPVVIPSAVNMEEAKKLSKMRRPNENIQSAEAINNQKQQRQKTNNPEQVKPVQQIQEVQQVQQPQKVQPQQLDQTENYQEQIQEAVVQTVKRGRGRPRKSPAIEETSIEEAPKKRRGRPRKNPEPKLIEEDLKEEQPAVLPGFEEENDEISTLPGVDMNQNYNDEQEEQYNNYQPIQQSRNYEYEKQPEETEPAILPGFDDEEESDDVSSVSGVESYNTYQPIQSQPVSNNFREPEAYIQPIQNQMIRRNEEYHETIDISNLLTSDKKIVSFVGTSKNGTSFIVNNIAELFSSMGINTAILDTTVNRNSYYIYTKNEEALRKIATESIEGLAQGVANGIEVNKSLTVYTSLPDQNDVINNVDKILETLVKKHSVVLIDCDFNTPIGYFKQSQETYLVQSMDILTIQPLTAFLRELKAKNVLDEKKLRIILNKMVRVRGISEKTIIGGMAYYNDPAMSYMTELFDRTLIKYIAIPFEEEVYTKYLESIINCDVNLKGYTKTFMQVLKELGNMIYPLVSGKSTYRPPSANVNSRMAGGFSPSINNTLDQMKRKY